MKPERRCPAPPDTVVADSAQALREENERLRAEVAGLRDSRYRRAHATTLEGGAGLTAGDGRPAAMRPMPAHALSAAERAEILCVANEPRFADVPPARIVPILADEGTYIASESSFARVLRANGQTVHRGRAKAPPQATQPPTTHVATAPRQVWCWDMT